MQDDVLEHIRDKQKEKQNREYVIQNLFYAAKAMQSFPGETSDFTQLHHTASSLLLLESSRERVYATLDWIEEKILKSNNNSKGIQATEVVTIAMLYYLILDAENMCDSDKEQLGLIEDLHRRLDQRNWCIGVDNMKALNIITLDQSYSKM
ncbi:MAG: hypothetical protein HY881_27675 [Deltaproteobacteria bacterium]|nr:hypothetical protein [Deltaproteobacteria bacterium]